MPGDPMSTILRYKKSLLALLAAVGVVVAFAADGEFSQNDILGTLAAVAGVAAVYAARNQPATAEVVDADVGTMDIGEALVIAILLIVLVFVLTRLF